MKIMINRKSFRNSLMLANWRGQSPQTEEQRRAMFARLGRGDGPNAVSSSTTSYRFYPESLPEKPMDPNGEIRAENWKDRLSQVLNIADKIGYVGTPEEGSPLWKYALATAAGIVLPGGTSGDVKSAMTLADRAFNIIRAGDKTIDATKARRMAEDVAKEMKAGRSGGLIGEAVRTQEAASRTKPSFQEVTKAQIPLLQKAGITDDRDLIEYSLSSVADGQVLRETTEAVMTGKMTEADAVAKLKSDFAKLKAEKIKGPSTRDATKPFPDDDPYGVQWDPDSPATQITDKRAFKDKLSKYLKARYQFDPNMTDAEYAAWKPNYDAARNNFENLIKDFTGQQPFPPQYPDAVQWTVRGQPEFTTSRKAYLKEIEKFNPNMTDEEYAAWKPAHDAARKRFLEAASVAKFPKDHMDELDETAREYIKADKEALRAKQSLSSTSNMQRDPRETGALYDDWVDAKNELMAARDEMSAANAGGYEQLDPEMLSAKEYAAQINENLAAAKTRYAAAKEKYLAAKAKDPTFDETTWESR